MFRTRLCLVSAVLAAAGLAGCQQKTFMTEQDFRHYKGLALTSTCADGQTPQQADISPSLDVITPTNVLSPEGKKRYVALSECIAIALENGRTGDFFDRSGSGRRTGAQGLTNASLNNPSSVSDSIRVFAYDPAITATDIDQSLAKFDAIWRTTMSWNKIDEPQSIQSRVFAQLNTTDRDQANFTTELIKPLPTGGLAGITFNTGYDLSNINQRAGLFNPIYTPSLEFAFEQPLLRGAGVAINQLRTTLTGGVNRQIPVGGQVAGILLTRIATDQAQVEFERRVQNLLFTVEEAYWELYTAYWDLYSRETAMRQAHAAWQIADVRYKVGKISGQDYAQIEEQFQFFRAQRLQALGRGTGRPGVLEAERRLRYVLGLPLDDGYRLVPVDAPTVAPFQPDWNLAVAEAMSNRPELIQVRQDIHAANLAVIREKDFLLPDVRFFALYDINSNGDRLDGTGSLSAIHNLAENRFNDWTLGIRGEVPIGFRDAYASVRRAQLGLAQRIAFLRTQETNVTSSLLRSYRDIAQFYEEIRIQRARREAATQQLQLRYQEFLAGRGTIDVLLESQRNWADALRDEHFAISDYNIALADFELQKGTILRHDNVQITDGPIPACAQARASEHIRQREHSIKLKDGPDCGCDAVLPAAAPAGELTAAPAATSLTDHLRAFLPELPSKEAMPIHHLIKTLRDQPAPPEKHEVPAEVKIPGRPGEAPTHAVEPALEDLFQKPEAQKANPPPSLILDPKPVEK